MKYSKKETQQERKLFKESDRQGLGEIGGCKEGRRRREERARQTEKKRGSDRKRGRAPTPTRKRGNTRGREGERERGGDGGRGRKGGSGGAGREGGRENLELALQLGIFGAEVLKGARARAKRALLLGQFIREDAKGDFIIVQLVEGLVDLLEEQLVRAEQRVADACRAKCVCST